MASKYKIGFIGLGKLGLPCALAIDEKGHDVWGYDINPEVSKILDTKNTLSRRRCRRFVKEP